LKELERDKVEATLTFKSDPKLNMLPKWVIDNGSKESARLICKFARYVEKVF